eukprot:CAMPEP_0194729688 /NCGR_PEP_ID=MMETSP0296-20130528/48709_1 /TAXON_ID=39354 /ORGANISM="Heterosigma akashiwo, Strain CCMP2393" /LENGTH=41 /DNA_ID= /DNA_START= /DNA_END= /DNA_ORIENTATION=
MSHRGAVQAKGLRSPDQAAPGQGPAEAQEQVEQRPAVAARQ